MSIFSRVYKPYTFGGREWSVKINIFSIHLYHFGHFFLNFHVDFWHSKNVDVYSLGGRGSQKVNGLYTRENVDI